MEGILPSSQQDDGCCRWADVDKLMTRSGPLAAPDFEPSVELQEWMRNECRLLVVGAGGLGCELLKDLALCGFSNIDVIDMDTIDVSNLNRQFLFRHTDVGTPKATAAARFINQRVAGCTVTPHYKRIEDYGQDFYRQFNLVICGLDSVVARRWINSMLHSLLVYTEDGDVDPTSMIPLIDGGTEGFKGSARVIFPGTTACTECTLDLYPPQVNFAMCTIAHTPRLPEHCIEYAKVVLWDQEKEGVDLDGDDPEHIQWLFEKAVERAENYKIQGVTYRLTQGVVKHIIPAVASTNAVIAAVCANEALKLASSCCPHLKNYLLFNDNEGVYTYSYESERKEDCLVCSRAPVVVEVTKGTTLTHLIDILMTSASFQMKAPGLTTTFSSGKSKTLYLQKPAAIEKATRKHLDMTLTALELAQGQILHITDVSSPSPTRIRLQYTDEQ